MGAHPYKTKPRLQQRQTLKNEPKCHTASAKESLCSKYQRLAFARRGCPLLIVEAYLYRCSSNGMYFLARKKLLLIHRHQCISRPHVHTNPVTVRNPVGEEEINHHSADRTFSLSRIISVGRDLDEATRLLRMVGWTLEHYQYFRFADELFPAKNFCVVHRMSHREEDKEPDSEHKHVDRMPSDHGDDVGCSFDRRLCRSLCSCHFRFPTLVSRWREAGEISWPLDVMVLLILFR